MAEFSIQAAALTGFRVVREHPAALGAWAVLMVSVSLLLSVTAVGMAGPQLADLMALGASPTKDPALILATSGRLGPVCAVLLATTLVSNAFLGAAMNRAVFNPSDGRAGFLRAGADELRQLGLGFLTFLVFAAAYVGLAFVFGLILVFVAVAAKPASPLALGIGFIGVFGGMSFLWVRLSLASALTFKVGRIDLFGSWALTRGRFWPLCATYGLALVLIVVVELLSSLFIGAVGALLGGGDPGGSIAQADLRSLSNYFTPLRFVQIALSACVSALVLPVWLTPPAAIYRGLAPSGLATTFA